MNLTHYEQENSIVFGLKWSLVGFALALCFLAGCSGLFDERVPRYNMVEGPRRPPPLNVEALEAAAEKQAAPAVSAPVAATAPAVAAPAMQERPVQEFIRPVQTRQVRREEKPWWDVTGWFEEDEEPVVGPVPALRAMPQENRAQLGYGPTVQAAPAAPVAIQPLEAPNVVTAPAPTPSAARTQADIAELERELAASNAQRAALMHGTGVTQAAQSAQVAPLQGNEPYPSLQPVDATPQPAQPQLIDRSNAPVSYKAVRLPPPPADLGPVPVEQATPLMQSAPAAAPTPVAAPVPLASPDIYYAPDPRHYAPQPVMPREVEAPVAPPAVAPVVTPASVPMPPVLSEQRVEQPAPVYYEAPQPVDVPMPPQTSYSPPMQHSAPIQLTPPMQGGYSGEGYLGDSRYTRRR